MGRNGGIGKTPRCDEVGIYLMIMMTGMIGLAEFQFSWGGTIPDGCAAYSSNT